MNLFFKKTMPTLRWLPISPTVLVKSILPLFTSWSEHKVTSFTYRSGFWLMHCQACPSYIACGSWFRCDWWSPQCGGLSQVSRLSEVYCVRVLWDNIGAVLPATIQLGASFIMSMEHVSLHPMAQIRFYPLVSWGENLKSTLFSKVRAIKIRLRLNLLKKYIYFWRKTISGLRGDTSLEAENRFWKRNLNWSGWSLNSNF